VVKLEHFVNIILILPKKFIIHEQNTFYIVETPLVHRILPLFMAVRLVMMTMLLIFKSKIMQCYLNVFKFLILILKILTSRLSL
jgi:hypothetical protein